MSLLNAIVWPTRVTTQGSLYISNGAPLVWLTKHEATGHWTISPALAFRGRVDSPVADTDGASRTTIDTGHSLAGVAELGKSSRTHVGDTLELATAVTTLGSTASLGDVVGNEASTRGFDTVVGREQ